MITEQWSRAHSSSSVRFLRILLVLWNMYVVFLMTWCVHRSDARPAAAVLTVNNGTPPSVF